jgi:hypothetical protein
LPRHAPQYAALVELSLPFNCMRVVGASVLLTAAGGCATLRRVDLQSNYIRDEFRVWPRSRDVSPSFSGSFRTLLDVLELAGSGGGWPAGLLEAHVELVAQVAAAL